MVDHSSLPYFHSPINCAQQVYVLSCAIFRRGGMVLEEMAAAANSLTPKLGRNIPYDYVPMPAEKRHLAGKITGEQHEIIDFILFKLARRAPGTPWSSHTPPISIQDFADYCHAPESSTHIRALVQDLEARGIIASAVAGEIGAKAKPKGHRAKCYQLLNQNWSAVPYPNKPTKTSQAAELPAAGPQAVVKPGGRSRIASLRDGRAAVAINAGNMPGVASVVTDDDHEIVFSFCVEHTEVTSSDSPVDRRNRNADSAGDSPPNPPAAPRGVPDQPPIQARPSPSGAAGFLATCKEAGLPVDPKSDGRPLAESMEALDGLPLDYLREKLADRVQRGKSRQTSMLTVGMLPRFVREQRIKWQAEGELQTGEARPHPKDLERKQRIERGAETLKRRKEARARGEIVI